MIAEKEVDDLAETITNCIGCRKYLTCNHKCEQFYKNKTQAISLAKNWYEKGCKETAKKILLDLKPLLKNYSHKITRKSLYEDKCNQYGIDFKN